MTSPFLRVDPLSRRSFVERIAKASFGVSLLPLAAQAGETDKLNGDVHKLPGFGKAKNVIWLQMIGGMSHIDTFDPKTGDSKGPSSPVKSKGGFELSGYLPKLATQGDKLTLIRSMTSKTGVHAAGQYVIRTAFEQRGTIRHPVLGAWAQKILGPSHKTLPSSVCINRGPDHGNGFFSAAYSPLPLHDPDAGLQYARGDSSSELLNKRLMLLNKLDASFRDKFQDMNLKSYTEFYDDTLKLLTSSDLKAFKLDDESSAQRDNYGRNKFGQGCMLARRLIEHGVRFVEVAYGGWDMHNDIGNEMEDKGTVLDTALSALIQDLGAKGLLNSTLIVVCSEFGRTPKFNNRNGRDHYPKVFTTVLAGGGVKGGYVHGSSDKEGREVAGKQTTIPDFHSTIGHAMGMDVDQVVMSSSGRPFTVGDKGKVVTEVFA